MSEPQYIRKLGKIGRAETPSYYVTLPRELIRQLGWRKGQKLAIRHTRGGHLIVEPVWYENKA